MSPRGPRLASLGPVLVLAACGEVNSTPDAADASTQDTPTVDGPVTGCDPMKHFAAPVPVPGLSTTTLDEYMPRLTQDELTIYFAGAVDATSTEDLYVARRTSLSEPFSTPTILSALQTSDSDVDPSISSDGLTLWIGRRLPNEGFHVFVTTRASTLADFGAPSPAAGINNTDVLKNDTQPFLTADGQELYFVSDRTSTLGGTDIWRVAKAGSGFGAPVHVLELASANTDWLPTPSADRLTIYFSSNRTNALAKGDHDIYVARRSTVQDGFGPPTLVEELNTPGVDRVGWLSPDNCRIYGNANGDIWMATRLP